MRRKFMLKSVIDGSTASFVEHRFAASLAEYPLEPLTTYKFVL